ncbi:MAG: D52 family tumor protein [Bacteroidales bacterium]|nr:D52 family tumor protein [Bacteroidales bacterium]
MENNELEEMRAQLATLNEKLEGESIVDERHFSEATKKHLSELQRKLIRRIVLFGVLAPFLYYFLGLYFGLWCLGIVILSIYVYLMTGKAYSVSMTVTEYTQRIRKALKTYKKANKIMWILSILLILAFGTYVLVYVLVSHSSNLGQALVVFIVCCFIALAMWVCYYISNVCVSPDVELMLEQVLEDLGEDNQNTE